MTAIQTSSLTDIVENVTNHITNQKEAEQTDLAAIQQIEERATLLSKLREQLELPLEQINKEVVDAIKTQFYKLRKQEQEQALATFVAEGNDAADFVMAEDPLEEQLRHLLLLYKEHRQKAVADKERMLQENLQKKRSLLNQMQAIVIDADQVNKEYAHFQELSAAFKEIREIPATEVTELWKEFQSCTEQFYDMLKINRELRDYDFKKNFEYKEAICREAEALCDLGDVVSAIRRLQELHDEWRHTGPVAPQVREELWNRFKTASSQINKVHQIHFEEKKLKELENEQAKQRLCEQIEAIDLDSLVQITQWEEQTKVILGLQQEWKTLGFASKRMNTALFERFRKSCDAFFERKSLFYKQIKTNYQDNLRKKEELCLQAEANKDRTDWRKAVEFFVSIQQQWKEVGPVQHKHSDAVWLRFKAACDYFFENKSKNGQSSKQTEYDNLAQKQAVLETLKGLTELPADEDVRDRVSACMTQWKQIGHVPFKEKDRIFDQYQALLDILFARKAKGGRRSQHDAPLDLANMGTDDQSMRRILKERERLVRHRDQLIGDLKTYENNMGFLTKSSKGANRLVEELQQKQQVLRDQIGKIEQQISLIDAKLEI